MSTRDEPRVYVILVGTDYSDASDEALQQAVDHALERETAAVHVLHVMEAAHTIALEAKSEVTVAPEAHVVASAATRLRDHVRERLLASNKDCNRLQSIDSHVLFEDAAEELVRFASRVHADLMVVGTHPRRGASVWQMGSVAEKVVPSAPCPVLVARRKDEPGIPSTDPSADIGSSLGG